MQPTYPIFISSPADLLAVYDDEQQRTNVVCMGMNVKKKPKKCQIKKSICDLPFYGL